MDLLSFLGTLGNFILKCLNGLKSFLEFIFDFPSFTIECLSTLPSYFIVGCECILIFLAISIALKIYGDLH